MKQTRRAFIKSTGCALTAAAMVSSLDQLNVIHALAQDVPNAASDYKALVCIFLNGGNDGNNTIIPLDSEYNAYFNARNSAAMAIPHASLIPLPNSSGGGGRPFGMHPCLSPEVTTPGEAKGLLDLWNDQKLAIVFNMGNLVRPLTKAEYLTYREVPPSLFSHSNQIHQQHTSVGTGMGQVGWGGRIADIAGGLNGIVPLPMSVSLAGTSLYCNGTISRQLVVSPAPTLLSQVLVLSMDGGTAGDQTARKGSYSQIVGMDSSSLLVKSANETTSQSLITQAALSADPTVGTFPVSSIGNQLHQVAKLIKLKDVFGMKRQIFFCSQNGYDTHNYQTSATLTGVQGNLLMQLSQAMKAFYDEMVTQGLADQVTTFTQSDFSRTFHPSGQGLPLVGSDHAWGNHQFIMGGSVLGRRFYGTYPILAIAGPDDADVRGRWIPSISVDQYAATLASWYGGFSQADLAKLFPNLYRFSPANLGFLG